MVSAASDVEPVSSLTHTASASTRASSPIALATLLAKNSDRRRSDNRTRMSPP
jgi:hypothetical protein